MVLTAVTPTDDDAQVPQQTGYFRNPLPMSDGTLVAVHTPATGQLTQPRQHGGAELVVPVPPEAAHAAGRLLRAGGEPDHRHPRRASAGGRPTCSPPTTASLWELDPVEVVARPVPVAARVRAARDRGRRLRRRGGRRRSVPRPPARQRARADRQPQRHPARPRRPPAAVQPARAGRRLVDRDRRHDLRRRVSADLPGRCRARLRRPGEPEPRAPPARAADARRRRVAGPGRAGGRGRDRARRLDGRARAGAARAVLAAHRRRTAPASCASATG